MIRKISNIITRNDSKKILSSIRNIKENIKKYPIIETENLFKIQSINILKEKNLETTYNKYIIPEINNLSYNKYDFPLTNSYLEWSNTVDNLEYEFDIEKKYNIVLTDNKIKYCFYNNNFHEDFLTPNDILIFECQIPIRFSNHNKSNLFYFTFGKKYNINEKVIENEKQFSTLVSPL